MDTDAEGTDPTMTETIPAPGMSEAWRRYALDLREVAAKFGIGQPPCMPDEAEACGADYAQHAMNFLAAIQARAENGLWHLHHDQHPGTMDWINRLLEHWRADFERTLTCDGEEATPHA